MASETEGTPDVEVVKEQSQEGRASRSPDIGFDAALAPSCMIWMTAIILGILVLTILTWVLSNLDKVGR